MIEWLTSWQTLVGAGLGGVFALFVALIVGANERWRELQSALAHLTLELQQYASSADAIRRTLTKPPGGRSFEELEKAVDVLRIRFRPSSLFDTSVARAYSVDEELGAELGAFVMKLGFSERFFDAFVQLYETDWKGKDSIAHDPWEDKLDGGMESLVGAEQYANGVIPQLQALTRSRVPTFLVRYWGLKRLLGLRRNRHIVRNATPAESIGPGGEAA